MSRLVDAVAARIGYASTIQCNCIQAFLVKVKRWGIIAENINFDDIVDDHDFNLLIKHNSITTASTTFCQQPAIAHILWSYEIGHIKLTSHAAIQK